MLTEKQKCVIKNYTIALPSLRDEELDKLLASSEALALLADVRESKAIACNAEKKPHTSG